MTIAERVTFLRSTALFRNAEEALVKEVAEKLQEVVVAREKIIFREGDQADAFYIIYSGAVDIRKDGAGIAVRKPGEVVGELALIDHTARSFAVTARTDCRLFKVDRLHFYRSFSRSREFATGIVETLSEKLRQNIVQTPLAPTRILERPVFGKPEAGKVFAGRYLIAGAIGKGGMGSVYSAEDRMLGVPVAIKVLSLPEGSAIERLKREVILARKVAHRNVCRIFDIGENAGTFYVTMELLEGRTLSEILAMLNRFNQEIGLRVIIQVLEGLEEAHWAGVVHRDLKPQNIMIDSYFHARIMDFGISCAADLTRLTREGALVGTPHYIAPERLISEAIDHRADIYSAGVIMYEMFTGRLPFRSKSAPAVLQAHLNQPVKPPGDLVSAIAPELESVIMKCLAKKPEHRFQSATELLKPLRMLAKKME